MRVLELFGGYGSQALALENLGIDFTSDLCEIDKYAIQAYNQLHGETFNYGDICKIDETQLPYYDLITYSSPCQDFSVAGKQEGGEKGSGTRSSLLWECERIIRAVKPKYLLMENVKALTSKKFMPLFEKWLNTLDGLGYKNWWKVLNAKDYGVPQNRERVFVVSILGGGNYQFPEPILLMKRLKDVLEQNVDEKYYINKPFNAYPDGTARTIKQQYYKNSTSNFLRTDSFGATGVLEPLALDEQNGYVRQDGCVGTLTADGSSPKKNNRVIEPNILENFRIRKLTPRECWRLMGVRDEQFEKLHDISNSQLYKMAGNSIVVDVLMGIFKNLFIDKDQKGQLQLL